MAGARTHQELVCWQLLDEIRTRIYRILSTPSVRQDYEYCRQIRRAIRSAAALVAEGFGRRRHAEFARYLELSLGELAETQDRLRDGAQSGYIPVDDFRELWRLCYRANRASSALLRYQRRRIAEDQRADAEERRRRRKARTTRNPPTEHT
jgi:four helix bundle protein